MYSPASVPGPLSPLPASPRPRSEPCRSARAWMRNVLSVSAALREEHPSTHLLAMLHAPGPKRPPRRANPCHAFTIHHLGWGAQGQMLPCECSGAPTPRVVGRRGQGLLDSRDVTSRARVGVGRVDGRVAGARG